MVIFSESKLTTGLELNELLEGKDTNEKGK